MMRKVISVSVLAVSIATVILPVLALLSNGASAQSANRMGGHGCFDKSGKHHKDMSKC
jgi:hypothetical protein